MQKPIHAVDSLSSLDLYLGYCDEEYDDDDDDDEEYDVDVDDNDCNDGDDDTTMMMKIMMIVMILSSVMMVLTIEVKAMMISNTYLNYSTHSSIISIYTLCI
jgi:hypothetical protein